jgi:hypothetical protein
MQNQVIFCLLIYGRQQRSNHATLIFQTEEKKAGRLIRPCRFDGKRICMLMKKVEICPSNEKGP